MAHNKENDLMLAFYNASPLLQKQILNEYQHQIAQNNTRETLLSFLEERFRLELTMRQNSANKPKDYENRPHA